jgi:uncharacterized protein YjiK
MIKQTLAAAILAAAAGGALAQTSIGLNNYVLSASYTLDALGGLGLEASAVTYARDRGTLFYVGDEGLGVVEISRSGQLIGSMAFNWAGTGSSNNDAEGLTYLGGGVLVLAEERLQDLYRFSYIAGASVVLANSDWVSIGPSVGNVGIEGISVDARDGSFFAVKQDNPAELRGGSLNFAPGGGTSNMTTLFSGGASLFGLNSLSDVQTLSGVDSLLGAAAADNLLVLSLDSKRLIEIDRQGNIQSGLDLSGLTPQAIEGVTIDEAGVIYLVAEDSGTGNSRLLVLSPVPEPGSWALMAGGLLALLMRGRRKAA